ncbi:MAG: hypothetical protein CVV42_13970 [Candidatus Riflebacteria bacterium HGW-Riflebacteria-2]|nr:MAG: hypothetical protein CVV42_13970 [Candidatus Riflebacteria bacterium HGW-Riflebacteria-2]
MLFVFLALFAYAATWLQWKTPISDYDPDAYQGTPISIDDASEKTLFEQLRLQEVHQNYQTSYLDLVQRISQTDTTKINIQSDRDLFKPYARARADYQESLDKVEEYEKDFRVKCFARMRSLILAVLFYDRKTGTRMTKFNAEKLLEVGALQEIPMCPRGGSYSIIYKDGRRLFHCSIHGTLRN